ncbi:MAG: transporter [Rhodothermales bacterium]
MRNIKGKLETKFLIGIWLASWILLLGGQALPVFGQDLPNDLTELSLEELMQLDVIPVGVLGSHIHSKGEWMLGYRYMIMQMGEEEDHHGHDESFMITPTSMRMEMHMVEVMYGVTNRFTMMLMLPYKRLSMDHETHMGQHFTTASEGIGDLGIMAHYALRRKLSSYWVALAGFTLPTGSINQRDETPAGPDQPLPYPMQLGSGTVDLVTGLTYIHQRASWSWGVHGEGRLRLGRNKYDYRFGNTYHAGAWISKRVAEWFAPTLHLDGHATEDVDGAHPDLNPHMVPTADPQRQSDLHLSLVPSLNFHIPRGLLENHRLTIEGSFPLYHKHGGIPLGTQWQLMIAWQWTI